MRWQITRRGWGGGVARHGHKDDISMKVAIRTRRGWGGTEGVKAPDFWGRSPGFKSGISLNESYALQDHSQDHYNVEISLGKEGNLPLRQK